GSPSSRPAAPPGSHSSEFAPRSRRLPTTAPQRAATGNGSHVAGATTSTDRSPPCKRSATGSRPASAAAACRSTPADCSTLTTRPARSAPVRTTSNETAGARRPLEQPRERSPQALDSQACAITLDLYERGRGRGCHAAAEERAVLVCEVGGPSLSRRSRCG